ncbi:hypothetical protein NP493_167g02000 [Ridgeia piscesae]|uniref:ADP-ribosylhydrolase ARH3 n=1 Tax=Ridgeia piscesae TaxID=27915 RepID=A0AAD9UFG8_RIDPI|nr:hypothetical protein NP493_167g02000 [Ridgeia piscesae]
MAATVVRNARPVSPRLSKYCGALVGAVVGDCLGAYFECKRHVKVDELLNHFAALDSVRKEQQFTDDTAMARSVARSLVEKKGLDVKDMASRFVSEFYKEPDRGYGGSIAAVFSKLEKSGCSDPFLPAKEQFDGQGSFGNGGAMRISPTALYGYNLSEEELNKVSEDITRITHTHPDALRGAQLQCSAVRLALRETDTDHLNTNNFIQKLRTTMKQLENPQNLDNHPQPYCDKLDTIEEFLKRDSVDCSEVVECLGNDISALGSVPTAIYCFLRSLKPVDYIPKENPFERTILYAISLGGDTDTIATMAGAMAGAYYELDRVPQHWQDICEGVPDAVSYAKQLHTLCSDLMDSHK